MNEKEIRFIDLFGGIGGFRLGLEKANELVERTTDKKAQSSKQKSESRRREWEYATYKCVWYCDKDKYSCQTYNKNFKTKYKSTDITTINPNDIPDCDMLCGGFPCQSFSIAGKRKGFQDIRGTMFFEIYRIAQAKRPKILFLENVRGLLSADDGRCFGTILESLGNLGYKVEWQVLNSKYFGVPQNRERVFIIGHLGGTGRQQVFPIRQSSKELGQTSEESRGEGERFWDYPSNTIAQRDYKGGNQLVMQLCGDRNNPSLSTSDVAYTVPSNPMSDRQQVVIHSLQPRSPDRPSLKYSSGGSGHLSRDDGYSYCLDGGNCQAVEYTNNIRRLTPVECERLQGFPDNWTEGVSDTQRYKQLGNAVTVNVIQAIGERILQTKLKCRISL